MAEDDCDTYTSSERCVVDMIVYRLAFHVGVPGNRISLRQTTLQKYILMESQLNTYRNMWQWNFGVTPHE